jgi:hypothetical protein
MRAALLLVTDGHKVIAAASRRLTGDVRFNLQLPACSSNAHNSVLLHRSGRCSKDIEDVCP